MWLFNLSGTLYLSESISHHSKDTDTQIKNYILDTEEQLWLGRDKIQFMMMMIYIRIKMMKNKKSNKLIIYCLRRGHDHLMKRKRKRKFQARKKRKRRVRMIMKDTMRILKRRNS